jgi:hypothetical protein
MAAHDEITEAMAGGYVELATAVNQAIAVGVGGRAHHPLVRHIEHSWSVVIERPYNHSRLRPSSLAQHRALVHIQSL